MGILIEQIKKMYDNKTNSLWKIIKVSFIIIFRCKLLKIHHWMPSSEYWWCMECSKKTTFPNKKHCHFNG